MTVKQFKTYVRKGLGRAIIELNNCVDKEPFRASVLWACLNDYSYDTQSEGTRGRYTYELAAAFNDDGYFVERIAQKLINGLPYGWVFHHLCDVLYEFAAQGDERAKAALEQKYAELFNKMLVNRPKRGEVDCILEYYENISICICKISGEDKFTQVEGDISAIISRNKHYDKSDFDLFHFERDNYGKPEEPTIVTRRRSPTDFVAIDEVLSKIEKLKDYKDKDDEWHSLSLDIRNAADAGQALPREALMFVYQSPCAACRNAVLAALEKIGGLTDELLNECAFDCNPDTRLFAANISKSNKPAT